MIGLNLLSWLLTENTKHRNIGNNYLILLADNTMTSHKTFMDRLTEKIPNIHAVNPAEEFSFILVFVSRAGTDIEAALHKLNEISGTASAIVVVFHYTFNPEYIVPESHRVVNRENTLTVDCLFHEDQGLLSCQKNADSLNQVVNKIKSWINLEDLFDEQLEDTLDIFDEEFARIFRDKACSTTSSEQSEDTCFISSDIFDEVLAITFRDKACSTTSSEQSEDTCFISSDIFDEDLARIFRVKACSTTSSECFKHQFFSLTSGNTKGSHRNFIDRLMEKGLQIEEVDTPQQSDFIMFFCPVVSRAGTDIEAALRKLTDVADTKPEILVVLHYTFNPEWIVPESHRVVNREKTFTVDCLFHEDQGLLRCQKNKDSLNQVANYIKGLPKPKDPPYKKPKDTTLPKSSDLVLEPSASTDKDRTHSTTSSESQCIGNNYLILLSDNRMTSHNTFLKHVTKQIPNIQPVNSAEEFHFILVFCPVVSRAGTDIQAALHKLNEISGTATAILVVFHYTFNPECIVPESHRVVNRENTFTVDCLFHEDLGLLRCQKNDHSLNYVVNKIRSWIKPDVINDQTAGEDPYFTISDQSADGSEEDDSDFTPENQENAVKNVEQESTPAENQENAVENEEQARTPAEKVKKTDENNNEIPSTESPENQQNTDKKDISRPAEKVEKTDENNNEIPSTKSPGSPQTQNEKNDEDETWESIAVLWYERSYWVF